MIIGHRQQIDKLNILFKKKCIPHALLFSGPNKVGKRTVAVWFLKMINCLESNSPCGECKSCREINEGVHFDMLYVAPEKKEIHLKQIEDVIEKISFKGIKANFKGIIIDSAHLMNVQAQNSLLKILEEPPGNTVIILISEYPRTLLSTITSRTSEIKFSFVSEEEMKKEIESDKIVSLSLGKPGLAIEYINYPERKEIIERERREAEEMFKNDLSSRFSMIKEIVKEERSEEFLNSLLKITEEKMKLRLEERKSAKIYQELIKEIEKVIFLHSKTNINKQIALEKIVISI